METTKQTNLSNYLEFTIHKPGILYSLPIIFQLLCGAFLIAEDRILPGILFSVFALIWLRSTGVRFKVSENLYKKYTNIAGVKIGRWENLPVKKFILLKKNSNVENFSSIFGDSTERETYFTIFLKDKNSKFNIPLYTNLKQEEAKASAEELAAHFDCELITYLK